MNTHATTYDFTDRHTHEPAARLDAPAKRKLAAWARAYDASLDAGNTARAGALEPYLRGLTPHWWLYVRHATPDDDPDLELADEALETADTIELTPDEVGARDEDGCGDEDARETGARLAGLIEAYEAAIAIDDCGSADALAAELDAIDEGWFLQLDPGPLEPVPPGMCPYTAWDGWGG
jgi:hypothetical protein